LKGDNTAPDVNDPTEPNEPNESLEPLDPVAPPAEPSYTGFIVAIVILSAIVFGCAAFITLYVLKQNGKLAKKNKEENN
jgi:hypothetical protein